MTVIREHYRTYVAPKWVERTVRRLLASIPDAHLTGLSSIVLTDSTAPVRGRRQRRNRRHQPLGSYHMSWRGAPAWIELVVDRIVAELPRPLDRLQVTRDLVFGRVLFHEVGHHLHATRRGIASSHEASAENWSVRLARIHIARRYGYMRPLAPVLRVLRQVAVTLSRTNRRAR